jgi:cellulase
MASKFVGTTLALLSAAASVSAHGHPHHIVIGDKSYKGWDLGIGGDELTVGWQGVPDDGPVGTAQYQSADIICHNSATPAPGHAVVEAGQSIFIQYDVDHDELGQEWPEEHKGPIKDMLAACGDSGCESVDKEQLEFFTIAEAGLINDDDVSDGGRWPTDILREQGSGWLVVVPPNVAPGFYVLRHEIIALHNAPDFEGGAQNYPFCFNLEVTGSGTDTPQGTKPVEFYKKSDPGIDVSIWDPLDGYVIPGPGLIDGVEPVVQSVMVASGEGEIRTGSERVQQGGSTPTLTPTPTPTPEDDDDDDEYNDEDDEDDEDEDAAPTATVFVTVTVTKTATTTPAGVYPNVKAQETGTSDCDKTKLKARRRRHMRW